MFQRHRQDLNELCGGLLAYLSIRLAPVRSPGQPLLLSAGNSTIPSISVPATRECLAVPCSVLVFCVLFSCSVLESTLLCRLSCVQKHFFCAQEPWEEVWHTDTLLWHKVWHTYLTRRCASSWAFMIRRWSSPHWEEINQRKAAILSAILWDLGNTSIPL